MEKGISTIIVTIFSASLIYLVEHEAQPEKFSSIPEAVEQIKRGGVVIVLDDEDRENEGDFICAAEKATAENVNFMLNGRGEFCMPVLPEVCERLELTPIVDTNTAPLGTGFAETMALAPAPNGDTIVFRFSDLGRSPSRAVR